jgi:hypothetical protein
MTQTESVLQTTGATPAAERMRICRERRREKKTWLPVEIHEVEIEALIKLGHLDKANRKNKNEILQGLYRFLDVALVA